ncbi:MAG: hypothetical protein ABIH64_06370 [Nanoarchaeota archaeon]
MQNLNKSRDEQIIRWANYVRSHKDWKRTHTDFINAQFIKYSNFIKRLVKTENGKEKLRLLTK